MYQAKSEAREFVGGSYEEALGQATRFFGVEESALKISELPQEQVQGLVGRSALVAQPKDAPVREQQRNSPREEKRERRPDSRREKRPQREPQEETSSEDEMKEVSVVGLGDIGEFVRGVIERMGIGVFELEEKSEDEIIVLALNGPAAKRLTEEGTRAVDAIQLLANQALMRGESEARRVVLDVDGDREKRVRALEKLADRAAQRAGKTGRAVALEPMNGKDRRIIHIALKQHSSVATMSIGEGHYRQVVVVPEGSPDYETARQSSDSPERGRD